MTSNTAEDRGPSMATGPGSSEKGIDLSRKPRPGESIIMGLLRAAAFLSVFTTIGILVSLAVPAIEFFRKVSIVEFLTSSDWSPNLAPQSFGVLPIVAGTIVVTAVGLIVAIPLGLGAAMYLSEYASAKTRARLKPVLELLAGIPSVVYGFFALSFVTPILLKDILHMEVGYTNALAAGIVLGVMIIPTIASLSEDAMSAVPHALREGSFAMGANRMQTTLRVVFPAAISGIAAAVVLGLSRAIGETMIVALAAGSQPNLSADPREPMQTMTGFIATTAGGENPVGSLSYNTLFAVGLLLFFMTLLINVISIALVRRYRQAY